MFVSVHVWLIIAHTDLAVNKIAETLRDTQDVGEYPSPRAGHVRASLPF
jgi:hypothetical protein